VRQPASGPVLFNSSPPDIPVPRYSRCQYHWHCICSIYVIFSLPFSLSKPYLALNLLTPEDDLVLPRNHQNLENFCLRLITSDPLTPTHNSLSVIL
jgi:hypothetical protein